MVIHPHSTVTRHATPAIAAQRKNQRLRGRSRRRSQHQPYQSASRISTLPMVTMMSKAQWAMVA